MSAAIVDGEHLHILVATAAVELLILDPQVGEMDLFVEVRKFVFDRPLLDLARIAIGVTVVLVAVTVALMEPLLVVTLELVVEDHALDSRATRVEAFGFAFECPIDLHVVLKLPLAFDARVEALTAFPIAVTMALEQAAALLRERHGVVARAGNPRRLDQPLLAEMSKVAGSRISGTIVVVSEITTGDHSKRSDGRERSRFRTTQRVLAIAITHDLPLASSRQVQVSGEDVPRVVPALAVGPALVVSIARIRF